QIVALARPPLPVGKEFRDEKQRDAAAARRRIGGARQYHMNDVVGQVVVAVSDENLLAGDAVVLAPSLVFSRHGARAQGAEVGAGLRLGQIHRAGPFAGYELAEVEPLLLWRAVRHEHVDRAE